jgi:hypothetical protein
MSPWNVRRSTTDFEPDSLAVREEQFVCGRRTTMRCQRSVATYCGALCHLAFSAARPVAPQFERVKVTEGTFGKRLRQRRWRAGLEQALRECWASRRIHIGTGR